MREYLTSVIAANAIFLARHTVFCFMAICGLESRVYTPQLAELVAVNFSLTFLYILFVTYRLSEEDVFGRRCAILVMALSVVHAIYRTVLISVGHALADYLKM